MDKVMEALAVFEELRIPMIENEVELESTLNGILDTMSDAEKVVYDLAVSYYNKGMELAHCMITGIPE